MNYPVESHFKLLIQCTSGNLISEKLNSSAVRSKLWIQILIGKRSVMHKRTLLLLYFWHLESTLGIWRPRKFELVSRHFNSNFREYTVSHSFSCVLSWISNSFNNSLSSWWHTSLGGQSNLVDKRVVAWVLLKTIWPNGYSDTTKVGPLQFTNIF